MKSKKHVGKKPISTKKPFPRIALNDKELNVLYDSILKSKDIFLYSWTVLASTTGLRSLQLANLKWTDIHHDAKVTMPNGITYIEITAYDEKFNREKTIYAPSMVLYGLTTLWFNHPSGKYIFFQGNKIASDKIHWFINKMHTKLAKHFNLISKTISKKDWAELALHPNMTLRRSAILSLLEDGMNANAIAFLLDMSCEVIEMWTRHNGLRMWNTTTRGMK